MDCSWFFVRRTLHNENTARYRLVVIVSAPARSTRRPPPSRRRGSPLAGGPEAPGGLPEGSRRAAGNGIFHICA